MRGMAGSSVRLGVGASCRCDWLVEPTWNLWSLLGINAPLVCTAAWVPLLSKNVTSTRK